MKATACTKCRQSKVRCDGGVVENASLACSRCRTLGYVCVFDASFKRTSKAKLISKMASEIQDLRQSLENTGSSPAVRVAVTATTTSPSSSPALLLNNLSLASAQVAAQSNYSAVNPTAIQVCSPSPNATGSSPAIPECLVSQSSIQFQSTQPSPGQDLNLSPPATSTTAVYASIGNVSLSASQVAEMFKRFFSRYAQNLPFRMRTQVPLAILQQSSLLFWVICAITSDSGQARLLEPLVKTLITDTIHAQYHSVETVQALLLLCIWPFRVSFLGEERSYFYSSMATQIGFQLGLHRPTQPHMYRLVWETQPVVSTDVKLTTYLACFIVDKMVSGALGNPPSIIADSHFLNALSDPSVSRPLSQLCRIYHLLSQSVSEISSDIERDASDLQYSNSRSNLIMYFLNQMSILQSQHLDPVSDIVQLHFLYARIQILTFVLLNDSPFSASDLALNTLEEEVCDLVDLCESTNLSLAPSHVRRAMVYCGFVLSRLLRLSYSTQREVFEEKLQHVWKALAATASSTDDVVNKSCIILQTLPFVKDLKQSPPIVSRMASWISYDERRIFWENRNRMHHLDGDAAVAVENEVENISRSMLESGIDYPLTERSCEVSISSSSVPTLLA